MVENIETNTVVVAEVLLKLSRGDTYRSSAGDGNDPDGDRLVVKSIDDSPSYSVPSSLESSPKPESRATSKVSHPLSPPPTKKRRTLPLSFVGLCKRGDNPTNDQIAVNALADIQSSSLQSGIFPRAAVMKDLNLKRRFIDDAEASPFGGGNIFDLLRAQGRITGKGGSAITQHEHVTSLAKHIARESSVLESYTDSESNRRLKKLKGWVRLVGEPSHELPKRGEPNIKEACRSVPEEDSEAAVAESETTISADD